MKLPQTATIDGKRYAIVVDAMRRSFGTCDPPSHKGKTIRLDAALLHPDEWRQLMVTLLHEGLHAADFDKDERWVEVVAEDLGRLLVAFGFTRQEE